MNSIPAPKPSPAHSLRRLFSAILCAAILAGCASTGNNFDDTKLSQIKKGETTEADLVKLFGSPQNRTINAEGVTTLTWMYAEANVKAESFIPYAGVFMGGSRGSSKSLAVTLVADKVTGYTFSGGGSETRNTTQSAQKN